MPVCSSFIFAVSLFLVGSSFPAAASDAAALVDGAVVNKVSGAPVKGAHVIYTRLASGSQPSSSPISRDTDSQGHFQLELEPGSYRVWVERAGFARQNYGSIDPLGSGSVLSVASGQHIRDILFRVTPLGAISGRIIDEDGDAVSGVSVQVLRVSYTTGKRQLIPVTGATSDDRGEYRCYDLPPHRYLIMATPQSSPLTHPVRLAALIPEVQDTYVPVYYPGVIEADAASAIILPEGADIPDVNLQLLKVRSATVRGRLVGSFKAMQRQVQVVLAHNDHGSASFIDRHSGVIDTATGRFEIAGIAPGSYLLMATQLSGTVLAGRIPLEVSPELSPEDIALPLSPAFQVQGSVLMEDGSPAARGIVVRLLPTEGILPVEPLSAPPSTDGSFQLSGALPGMWEVSVEHLPDGVWLKGISFGDQSLSGSEVNMQPGMQGALSIVLGANGAQVSGIVKREGRPHSATVVLAPLESELQRSTGLYRVAFTDANGIFLLKSITPGKYRLFAFESIEPFSWMDPEVLNSVKPMSESISLVAGDQVIRHLIAISYDTIVGSQ